MFSYGEGTTVNISDSEIYTTKDNSGGIQTTGEATMNAKPRLHFAARRRKTTFA